MIFSILGRHRGALASVLVVPVALAVAWWTLPVEPRATWNEAPGDLGIGIVFAFTPDGRSILSDVAGQLTLRDADTGRVRATLEEFEREGKTPDSTEFRDLSFSADGSIAVGLQISDSQKGTESALIFWDLASGRIRHAFDDVYETGFSSYVTNPGNQTHKLRSGVTTVALARGQDGQSIITEVWDLAKERRVASFTNAYPIALSPDGRKIVLCDSRGGRRLTSGDDANRLSVRDVRFRRILFTQDFDPSISNFPTNISLSPGGNFLAKNDDAFELWDLRSGRMVFSQDFPKDISATGYPPEQPPWFTPDGRYCFREGPTFSPVDTGELSYCLDLGKGQPTRYESIPQGDHYHLSPDGTSVAILAGTQTVSPPPGENRLWLFDLSKGADRFSPVAGRHHSYTEFSGDGRLFGTFVMQREWDIFPGWPWFRIHFSDLLRRVLRSEFVLRDAATGREVGRIPKRQPRSCVTVFSPEGDRVALKFANPFGPAASAATTVEIWDIPPRRPTWGIALAVISSAMILGIGLRSDARRSAEARRRAQSQTQVAQNS